MADTVTSQTIEDGPRTAIFAFTNVSDGTGESAVTKIDVSSLSKDPLPKTPSIPVEIQLPSRFWMNSSSCFLASKPCGPRISPCEKPSTHRTSAASLCSACLAIFSASRMAS